MYVFTSLSRDCHIRSALSLEVRGCVNCISDLDLPVKKAGGLYRSRFVAEDGAVDGAALLCLSAHGYAVRWRQHINKSKECEHNKQQARSARQHDAKNVYCGRVPEVWRRYTSTKMHASSPRDGCGDAA